MRALPQDQNLSPLLLHWLRILEWASLMCSFEGTMSPTPTLWPSLLTFLRSLFIHAKGAGCLMLLASPYRLCFSLGNRYSSIVAPWLLKVMYNAARTRKKLGGAVRARWRADLPMKPMLDGRVYYYILGRCADLQSCTTFSHLFFLRYQVASISN